jgi:membrane-associated protease RseP (regulator of RpoE activity)
MPYVKLLLVLPLVQALHLLAMAFVGVKVGATLKIVRFGFGPELFRFNVRGSDVGIGPFPLGGYVQFWQSPDEKERKKERKEGVRYFDELSGPRRAAAELAGPVSLFVAACLATMSFAWAPFSSGFLDYVGAVLAPKTRGVALLGEASAAIRALPFISLFGLACAKVAAWNLLPLPVLNGGAALMHLALPMQSRARAALVVVGLLVTMAATVSSAIALWTFVRS